MTATVEVFIDTSEQSFVHDVDSIPAGMTMAKEIMSNGYCRRVSEDRFIWFPIHRIYKVEVEATY